MNQRPLDRLGSGGTFGEQSTAELQGADRVKSKFLRGGGVFFFFCFFFFFLCVFFPPPQEILIFCPGSDGLAAERDQS